MKHLSLPKPHVPTVSKTVLLVALAVILVLVVLVYGAYQHHVEAVNEAVAARVQAEHAHTVQAAEQQAYKEVQADLNKANARAEIACSVLKQYSLAATTKRYVSVPPACSL